LIWIVLGALGVWIALIWSLQRLLVFPTWVMGPAPALRLPPGGELLTHETPEGTIEALFLPADGASPSSPRPVVVFAHGNAERIDDWPTPLARYRAMGLSVLLCEYRGYGRSAGAPSQAAIVEDFARWVSRIHERPDVDPTRTVYHGRSLGGGIVSSLAERHPPAALILESTFTSVASLAARRGVPPPLVRDPLPVERVLQRLDVPVLIVHGKADTLIPASHAEANARAAPHATTWWHDGGHNDPPPAASYWSTIESFLTDAAVLEAGRPPE
jgi:alpha-beta hydrolase superfamily lysophospholipase